MLNITVILTKELHYAKIWLSLEVYDAGENGKKEDDQKQDGWLNLVTTTCAWLEDLELGGGQIVLQKIYLLVEKIWQQLNGI